MIKYDLHVHSNYSSDASQSIEEIFQRARKGKIKYLSICDHDNIDSIPEAYKIAPQYKIVYIPGVELSCSTDDFYTIDTNKYWDSHIRIEYPI